MVYSMVYECTTFKLVHCIHTLYLTYQNRKVHSLFKDSEAKSSLSFSLFIYFTVSVLTWSLWIHEIFYGLEQYFANCCILCCHRAFLWSSFCNSWWHSSRWRFNTQKARLRESVRFGNTLHKACFFFHFHFWVFFFSILVVLSFRIIVPFCLACSIRHAFEINV